MYERQRSNIYERPIKTSLSDGVRQRCKLLHKLIPFFFQYQSSHLDQFSIGREEDTGTSYRTFNSICIIVHSPRWREPPAGGPRESPKRRVLSRFTTMRIQTMLVRIVDFQNGEVPGRENEPLHYQRLALVANRTKKEISCLAMRTCTTPLVLRPTWI